MRIRLVAVLLVAGVAGGCGESSSGATALTVLAASSLTEALDAVAPAFESAHPDVDVTVSVAGSSALAAQVESGGPGDVVVTADETTMRALRDDGLVGDPVTVARNRLAILVEEGNPKSIGGLADLARDDVVVVLCAPQVPCGRSAERVLADAGVDGVEARSFEENVKAVAAKVALGEADAGIVYATDVRAAAGDADGVAIAGAGDPSLLASYPAAVVDGTDAAGAAAAFVAFLTSAAGQRLLAAAGFLPAA